MAETERLYGLMAEFATPDALVLAAGQVHREGYTHIDALTPMPVEGLAEIMGFHDRRIQKLILCGGILGCLGGLGLQLHVNLLEKNLTLAGIYLTGYPLNIGGRPLISLPSFIVPAFETTILLAALTAVLGTIALCGLPMPYHPVFNVKRFRERGSTDGLFLCIEATDPKFDPARTRELLASLGARGVYDVEK
jgi:Protein of unknown function (DUF3341)